MTRAFAGLALLLVGVAVLAGAALGGGLALVAAPSPSGIAALAGGPNATNGPNGPSSATTPGPSWQPAPGASAPPGSAAATPSFAIPSPSPTATPSASPALVADSLDGLPVTAADAARHPIAVMVDDLAPARPQSGFSAASVVWQAPAEGGIPRYMMVFSHGLPGALGPVRSARYYFIAWAAEWRALYVHSGGSPQALSTLRAQGRGQLVFDADEFRYGSYLWRVRTRYAPHNLYTDGPHVRALAAVSGATAPTGPAAWAFGPDAPFEARPTGGTIEVDYPYNVVRYAYDRTTNTYLRSVSGEGAQHDAATGARVAPKNVVIIRMRFGPLGDGHPAKGRLEAAVVGSGSATISTNGVTVRGTWRKASLSAPTILFDRAGRPVTLTAGQTFVQVVPLGWRVVVRDGRLPAGPTPAPS